MGPSSQGASRQAVSRACEVSDCWLAPPGDRIRLAARGQRRSARRPGPKARAVDRLLDVVGSLDPEGDTEPIPAPRLGPRVDAGGACSGPWIVGARDGRLAHRVSGDVHLAVTRRVECGLRDAQTIPRGGAKVVACEFKSWAGAFWSGSVAGDHDVGWMLYCHSHEGTCARVSHGLGELVLCVAAGAHLRVMV